MAPMPVVVPQPVEVNSEETPSHRAASHYLWAMLLARIYETLPLVCPNCHAPMRIIAFIIEGSSVRKILDHLGESAQSPKIAPARGPPLWEAAMASEQAGNNPEWDMSAQLEPVFEFDQRIAWRLQFCSPWVGLCAGFGVRRFLVLMRPIFSMGMGEVRNLNGFDDGNWISEGRILKFWLTCAVEFPILRGAY